SPDGVYAPLARYPLERVETAVGELDPRAGDQILDRSGDEDLARTGECRNAGARVHRDPAHRVARELDLAGVNARAHLQPELRYPLDDTPGAADRARGAVERAEEPAPRRIDLGAPEPIELSTDERMVLVHEVAPAPVSELARLCCGADDVREEHRCEHAVGLDRLTDAGQELLDLVQD